MTGWEISVDPSISTEGDEHVAILHNEDSSDSRDAGESEDGDSDRGNKA